MEQVFAWVNSILAFVGPLSDFFWDFPTNIKAYKAIPLLGDFSLAVIILVGSGLYFSFRLKFIQVTQFKAALRLLVKNKQITTGISPLAAFMLSSAMRVGPGNILGVTGAISVGGPGALFWMWISGFFGMATAYVESTLAQLFKEKKGDEYVGGLPFYGRCLMGNKAWVGVFLSGMYILYALGCLPAQGFNVVSSLVEMASIATGVKYPTQSTLVYVVAALVMLGTIVLAFGGIHKVTAVTDKMVPVMAIIYVSTVVLLILANIGSVPYFFQAVFVGAFKPEAIFGGFLGTAVVQGVKRGLMSNEAGQGTITMAAAAADADHPCEQGLLAAIGVMLDTHIICTMTGFIVVMAHSWTMDLAIWEKAGKLPKFLLSVSTLTPGVGLHDIVTFMLTLCFCLFAYTCLIGMITFPEIAAARISKSRACVIVVRCICLAVAAFGIVVNIAGYDLGNLWAFSDLANILIVYANIPNLYLGLKYVVKATEHYRLQGDRNFTGEVLGSKMAKYCVCWQKNK